MEITLGVVQGRGNAFTKRCARAKLRGRYRYLPAQNNINWIIQKEENMIALIEVEELGNLQQKIEWQWSFMVKALFTRYHHHID
jgi:hypothetical protein